MKSEDLQTVRDIAKLARIKIDPSAEERIAEKFSSLKTYFDKLAKIDIKAVKIDEGSNLKVLHPDKPEPVDIDLDAFPYIEDRMFKVPRVIE